MMRGTYDRLDTAGNSLVVIGLVSVIALAIITMLSIQPHRDSQQMTQMWIQYLALNTPAIVPSGRVLHNGSYTNPAFDQRHSPHLPFIGFSSENMIGSLKPERGEIPLKN